MSVILGQTGVTFPDTTTQTTAAPVYKRAMFCWGLSGSSMINQTNVVSSIGVVANDVFASGTRYGHAGAGLNGSTAIFAYGFNSDTSSNLTTKVFCVNGFMLSTITNTGTAGSGLCAASYGVGKAVFAMGYSARNGVATLIDDLGNAVSEQTGWGTGRGYSAAASYGVGKAIIGYGTRISDSTDSSLTNLVSDTGVVASDTTGVGTARTYLAAASYGVGKAIFGYGEVSGSGSSTNITNLVSDTGVVASDTTGVGTARKFLAAASYGNGRAIFYQGTNTATNLVSDTGVVASDTTGVGSPRERHAGASFI